jgi:hypothetical protein
MKRRAGCCRLLSLFKSWRGQNDKSREGNNKCGVTRGEGQESRAARERSKQYIDQVEGSQCQEGVG